MDIIRADKVGWPRTKLHIEFQQQYLLDYRSKTVRDDLIHSYKADLAFCSHLLVICYYLADRLPESFSTARLTLEYVDDYLFGEWRDRIRCKEYNHDMTLREFWDRDAAWLNRLIPGLLWSAVLGDWDNFAKVGTYLRDNVCIEESEELTAWYLILSGVARGRPWEEMEKFIETIRQGKSKRERLLLDALSALLGKSDAPFQAALNTHFDHYKRTEAKKDEIPSKLAIDGSILVHLARHRGLEVTVPAKVMDHFIELEAI